MDERNRQPYLLHDWLRHTAARRPSAPAIRAAGDELSYAELDATADRVASSLAELGVRAGDRVGLSLPTSVEAVACLYGVLRAGAAYVPIDPRSPATRAAGIARDGELAALVSTEARIDELRAVDPLAARRGIACSAVAPDGFLAWKEVLDRSAVAPPVRVVDTDLAYVLYTSGSTGRPKGVALSHRNALTFVRWAVDELDLQAGDVFANHAPLHFDLSTLDLFGAVVSGGTVSVVPPLAASFPAKLAGWIESERISVWYSVPSALSMLVRYGRLPDRDLSALRLVLFAGEVFPVRYLRALMEQVPAARFVNLYGPTETNVCTFEEVGAPPSDDRPVPIGRCTANARGTVLTEDGTVVTGTGAVGELVITGSTVAQGYWGDAERTTAAFVGRDTYRTGDLVEVLDDSDNPRYRFLGRRDSMVKTRGYRVELGEVEAALHADPRITEAVAVAVPDELLGSRIVAFCTVGAGPAVDEHDVRRRCGERVPEYMVPARVFLGAEPLPRISTDKYDRRRLAEQASARLQEAQ